MISKIEKQRQRFLNYTYSDQRTLAQINPVVNKVKIDYTLHWFDLPSMKKDYHLSLSPNRSVIILADCPNENCASNGFDLSGVLKTMLVHNRTEENGTIKCDRCSAKLDYSIKIEYSA